MSAKRDDSSAADGDGANHVRRGDGGAHFAEFRPSRWPGILHEVQEGAGQAGQSHTASRAALAREGNDANGPESESGPRDMYRLTPGSAGPRESCHYPQRHPSSVIFGRGSHVKRVVGLTVMLLLAGCASGTTTYLQLAPVPTGHQVTVHGAAIAIDHVQMPATIDRLYLTTATGADTLSVAGHARWVAPLDGMATRVLAIDLARRIDGVDVLMPGDPAPPAGARHVRVNVTQFLPIVAEPGTDHVVLDADWQLIGRDGTVLHSGRNRIRVESGATPAAQAGAMSQALGHLADLIAGALASH